MTKKILYPVAFILVVWYFVWGIPLDTWDSYTTILTLIGGIGSTVLLAFSLFHIFPMEKNENKEKEKQQETFGCVLMAIIGVYFFAFSIYLIFRSTDARSDELKEYGVYTVGTVIDGSSFKTRKVDMTDLTISFIDEDGTEIIAKAEISASQFDNYGKGQKVQIVYSKKHPHIIALLARDADIESYTGIKVRELRIDDLYKVMDLKPGKPTQDYLNSINRDWKFEERAEGMMLYNNEVKNIGIRTMPHGELTYMHSSHIINIFENDLRKKGLEPATLGGRRVYTDGKYTIAIRREKINNVNSHTVSMDPMSDYVSVISILKTE